ncbi:unnamed protein product [Urochloa humidicola]
MCSPTSASRYPREPSSVSCSSSMTSSSGPTSGLVPRGLPQPRPAPPSPPSPSAALDDHHVKVDNGVSRFQILALQDAAIVVLYLATALVASTRCAMASSCCVAAYLDMLDGGSGDEFDDSTCSSLEYTGNRMSSTIGRVAAVNPLLPIQENLQEASLPRRLSVKVPICGDKQDANLCEAM